MKSIFWMPVVSIWFCRLNLVWLCLSFFSSCGRSGLGPARYGVRIWRGQAIFPQRDSTWPKLWWGNELLVTCLVNYNNGHVLISLRKSVTRCLWNSCSPSSTSWMGWSNEWWLDCSSNGVDSSLLIQEVQSLGRVLIYHFLLLQEVQWLFFGVGAAEVQPNPFNTPI